MQSRGFDIGYDSVETNFSEQLWAGIKKLDCLSLKHADRPIVITCGSEESAKHTAANTKHHAKNNASGLGEAVDLRTFHYNKRQRTLIQEEFLSDPEINRNFDLIYEVRYRKDGLRVEHFHLEYDPK